MIHKTFLGGPQRIRDKNLFNHCKNRLDKIIRFVYQVKVTQSRTNIIEVQLAPLRKWFEVVDESDGLSDDCCMLKSYLEGQEKETTTKK